MSCSLPARLEIFASSVGLGPIVTAKLTMPTHTSRRNSSNVATNSLLPMSRVRVRVRLVVLGAVVQVHAEHAV